ncbi:hypothetical protein [Paenibacillus sp. HB172176]|uniref:hypothetical protein n=1 Tax=Paenibacillus sp. HB172176 TaxID=2493690 RepID=UPI00143C6443|nr:hypothetical protein [Paenibacillus sp. HB172176]
MNKWKWILIGSAAVVLIGGVVTLGILSLKDKLQDVNELQDQIAAASTNADADEAGDAAAGPMDAASPGSSDTSDGSADPQTSSSSEPEHTTELPQSSVDSSNAQPTNSEPAVQPTATPDGTPTASQQPVATKKPETSTEPASSATNEDAKGAQKQSIDEAITVKMEALQSSCTAQSNSLVQQIKKELSGDDSKGIETIQDKYLEQIIAAEASCDNDFEKLVNDAKAQYEAAGIDTGDLPDWSAEYDSAKQQARIKALGEIAAAMK